MAEQKPVELVELQLNTHEIQILDLVIRLNCQNFGVSLPNLRVKGDHIGCNVEQCLNGIECSVALLRKGCKWWGREALTKDSTDPPTVFALKFSDPQTQIYSVDCFSWPGVPQTKLVWGIFIYIIK